LKHRRQGKALKQAAQKRSIGKDEISACYDQREEAVIALVESLVERINELEARSELLENQKSKDSKKGLRMYLMEGQLLPSERTRELLQEVVGY
jgi:hypothetical protein